MVSISKNNFVKKIFEEINHRAPLEILAELRELESEISKGMNELEEMLK